MQKIVDVFAEADEKMLAAMLKAGVPLRTATIPEGKGIFVPWGWMSCEKNDNGIDASGWRWTLISDDISDDFDKLCSFSVPTSGAASKQNWTAALLNKVLEAAKASK